MLLATDDLAQVRALEARRIQATRANDVAALAPLLDEDLIYINSVGEIYSKVRYLRMIESCGLTYENDFNVRETECRVLEGLIIIAGIMLGHSRLEGEQQVFRYRSLGVWRRHGDQWTLLAWQSASPSTKLS